MGARGAVLIDERRFVGNGLLDEWSDDVHGGCGLLDAPESAAVLDGGEPWVCHLR